MVHRTTTHAALAIALLLAGAACSERPQPNGRSTIRLSPIATAASGVDAARLVDRDTTRAVAVPARTTVTLSFPHEVEVRRVKLHGARAVDVTVAGVAPGAPSADGWATAELPSAIATRELALVLEPLGAGATVDEIEVWGAGRDVAPRAPMALALATRDPGAPAFENVWALRASADGGVLQPAGAGEGDGCLRATFPDADVRQARRAWLAYEANVVRSAVLQHSFNGDAPTDGVWLAATSATRTIVDEVDPERLRGRDDLLLCLPPEAGGAVTVEGLRLLLLLDDGVQPFDRETRLHAAAATDGDDATAAPVPGGAYELTLDRHVEVEAAELRLAHAPASLQAVERHDGTAWRTEPAAVATEPVTALPIAGRAGRIRLTFEAPARADVPAASVAEVSVAGSGVGGRIGAPRIVITFPELSVRDGREIGERFGARAFVSGWAESPSGRGSVEIDGARVDTDGAFSVPLRRTDGLAWAVTLRARFPDGSEATRTIHLDEDRASELLGDGAGDSASSGDARFGRKNQTGWGNVEPDQGGRAVLGTDVSVEAPPGAVSARTRLGITRKGHEVMPPLDAGMVNVTAPAHSAYRFSPKGQKFAKAVKVTLPYDADLLPDGVAPEEIRTWFYDEAQGRWFALPRRQVLRERRQIVSETTHFTFMINAVLVLPEHPGPVSFNPTSLKDLKAADPSAGIDLVEPPVGNSEGTARVSFPIRLPKARGAHQPALALGYDSTGGNGWVGVGWDLRPPAIQIDGRYGVPQYDGEERYLLAGEQLVPAEDDPSSTCVDGKTAGRQYRLRVEKDFRRILRCGEDPTRFWFEVTDKSGTLHVYGHDENARLTSYKPRVVDPPVFPPVFDVAEWYLERVVDANGNLTEYAYQHDSRAPGDPVHREDFRQAYLRSIRYSGTAQRTGTGALEGGTSGPYLVELRHEAEARADVVTSARPGFKTVLRRRLAAIEAKLLSGFEAGRIREYRLDYETGDFGKSRLRSVEARGTDGRVFYAHRFEYETRTAGTAVNLFGKPTAWVTELPPSSLLGTATALGSTTERTVGFHGFVGLGLGFLKRAGTVGVGIGYSRRWSDTEVSFVDVNGDALPDRLYGRSSGNEVLFNTGAGRALSLDAPPGDPGAGQDVAFAMSHPLGKETGSSFDGALQVFGGPVALSFGASYGLSKSRHFLVDANGDGLVDVVDGGEVFFNQPRSAECPPGSTSKQCCRAGGFCFLPGSYPMTALEELAESSKLLAADATVASANQAISETLTPEDAVLEWTAPYPGRVDVSGALSWASPPPADGRHDGVRLRVYRYDPHDEAPAATELTEIVKAPGDTTESPLLLPNLEVSAGELLYFVVSTLSEFPTTVADGGAPAEDGSVAEALSPVEQVRFSPVITYLGTPATLRHEKDPTGAPINRFDAAADFVLAGEPQGSVTIPRAGDVLFTMELAKDGTNDDVRACIQYYAPEAELPTTPPRCRSTDFFYRAFGHAETHSDASPLRFSVTKSGAAAGGTFFIRFDTDLPIDPRRVRWKVDGSMPCVSTAAGCVAPPPDQAASLSFRALPYVHLHEAVVAFDGKWRPLGQRAQPVIIAPNGGTLRIGSYASKHSDRATPVYFAIRTQDRILSKRVGSHGSPLPDLNQSFELRPGDRVYFEGHTESVWSLIPRPAHGDWDLEPPFWWVRCEFESNGVKQECTRAPPITTDRSADHIEFGNTPVLAGGYHGWRYGAWQGKDGEDFAPWVFRGPDKASGQDQWSGDADEVRNRQKSNMKNENDPQRVRVRLLGLAVPSARGTRLQPGEPGLEPDVPAYVTQDGNTYFTAGRIHAGKKGQNSSNAARDASGARVVELDFQIGDIARTSTSVNVSAGISIGAAGVSASGSAATGVSQQKLDVLDMSGDGILDVVATAGVPDIRDLAFGDLADIVDRDIQTDVRITSPMTLATSRVVRMRGVPRLNYELSGQIGLGASVSPNHTTSKAEVRSKEARFVSAGGGVGFSVGTTVQDLVDINGDGLLDSVRRSRSGCASGLAVRLNMGTSFATGEDCVEAAAGAFPTDAFASALQPGGDATDADSERGAGIASGVLGLSGVRRTKTLTVQGTLGGGVDSDESYGAAVSMESSLTATNEALVDVTGDGLPDYVYKGNRDDEFHVRVNQGYGFAPPRAWRPEAAWHDAHLPRLRVGVPSIATDFVGRFVPALGGIDPLEATGTHSELPSLSVAFNFAFPLVIFPTPPWVHIGAGFSGSPKKVGGFELGLQDINGDGLVDHVLKNDKTRDVWARLNQLEKANLLKRVVRPLGGSFDLAYDQRAGNTVDMPQSRWLLSKVTVHDGRTPAGAPPRTGHDLETTYVYSGGRHDRIEREFLGFAKVERTNPDGTRVVQEFLNETVLRKGLLVSERLLDADERVWAETVNTWSAPIPVGAPTDSCYYRGTPIILNPDSWCGSFFSPLDRVERRFHEGEPQARVVTRQRFQYTTLGDVKIFDDDGDVADPGDDLGAIISYWSPPSPTTDPAWVDPAATNLYSVSRPKTVDVRDVAGNLLRARTAEYDGTGNLKTFRAAIGGGEWVESTLHWNLNGTLDWIDGPLNHAQQRYRTSYGYDAVAQTYVTSITDSHGYVSTAEYDARFGEVVKTTDANGNVTGRKLDVFGRVERIAGPYHSLDEPTIRIVYAPDAPFPYAWTRNQVPRADGDRRGTVDTVVAMDGLGRVVQTKKSAEIATSATTKGAGWSVTGHPVFDAMGRVEQQGQAFAQFSARPEYVPGTPKNPTRFVYDPLGRMIQTVEPNGALTRSVHGFGAPAGTAVTRFKTVTTDAEGRSKATYRDGANRIVTVEEHVEGRTPTTQYRYDPVGELTHVIDAAGNATAMTYDLLGRRRTIDNPDAGLVELVYDGAGNLRRRIDAEGRRVEYAYDYDLLTDVTYPTQTRNVHYRYGTAADKATNGVGRVVEVQDEAGRELRTYGKLGELASTTRILRPVWPKDGERTFTTSFTYDSFGRMMSITYPDGETVSYAYDAGGLLEKATGTRPASGIAPAQKEVYLASLGYDEFGQRVRMELGNGTVTTYGYEPLTRRLHALTTETVHGRTLQAITYAYDRVGNVTGMVNALDVPVGERSGETHLQFAYDELHRLTFASGWARTSDYVDQFTATYAYSDIHNMTSNAQAHEIVYGDGTKDLPPKTNHAFTYDYTGEGPHRAKKIGDTTLVYDRNGNTVRECRDHGDPTCQTSSDHLRVYAWTEENRLDHVIDGGGRNVTKFVYDAEGERVLKLGRGGESVTLGQFWALKGRRAATKHVFAGGTRIASKVLPPPGLDPATVTVVLASATGAETGSPNVGDGLPNDTGCDPSDYQPQKCPIQPGGDPSVTYPYDDTRVRPETYYYHPDHLGSTSWITDQGGRVHEHVEYFPYGEVWREPSGDRDGRPASVQRFLFTGKELDEETGLYYHGARYLDPRRARWLTSDPALLSGVVGMPARLSAYAYVRWHPLRLVDPDGRQEAEPEDSPSLSERVSAGYDAARENVKEFFKTTVWGTVTGMLPGQFNSLPPESNRDIHRNKEQMNESLAEGSTNATEFVLKEAALGKGTGLAMGVVRHLGRGRVVTATVRFLGLMDKHHALPKFLGGASKQVLSSLPRSVHREYHRVLAQNLRKAGIPLSVGGKGGSAADWAAYMRANPDAQRQAFDAVLETSRAIDQRFGSNITQDVWRNITEGAYVTYP
jgi:RHS repeat-associated protein